MSKALVVWKGDYIGRQPTPAGGWDWVTLVEFVDDEGKCRACVTTENELPFKPQWHPMSIRGFHQSAEVPATYHQQIADLIEFDGQTFWNSRLPENGAVSLHLSKERRDKYLRGEE